MQYHLDGYRTGNPHVFDQTGDPRPETPPDVVDVLIVGCGPAGLTLAAQLAAFPDIKTCIIDQKPGPLKFGQADGIACRSVEMFEAFGFAERVLREAYWVNETTFWKPDTGLPDRIARSDRIQDTEDGLSEFPHVILSQARVHDFYLDIMRNAPTRLEPYYNRIVKGLSLDRAATHPATVTIERADTRTQETITARYVVGCDGARSAVRNSLGRDLAGDAANQAWGVMDVLVDTDFPDIRLKSVIHSANEGSVLIIPREGGYLVRLYVELEKLNADERVSSKNITQDQLIAAAKRILHPYRFEVKEVAWWSVYEIGQRLCNKFDDADDPSSQLPHVFIAGDAGHTHSPKAGQGMNVSMGDAFNLGWKLASVLRGNSDPELLHSYSAERQAIAKELIDFDRAFAKMFSAKPKVEDTGKDADEDAVDPKEFQRYFQTHGRFTAGTSVHYDPSLITGESTHQHLAKGLTIGMRFHSAPVIRAADARPVHLGHVFKADGRWRMIAFGKAGAEGTDVNALCDFLTGSAASPLRRYTPEDADIDALIDVRAVFQTGHRALDIGTLHPLLRPQKGRYGLIDHEKVFCPDLTSGTDIFDMRGIDRTKGCVIIVRPDQYVAHVLPIDAYGDVSSFFDGFMRPKK